MVPPHVSVDVTLRSTEAQLSCDGRCDRHLVQLLSDSSVLQTAAAAVWKESNQTHLLNDADATFVPPWLLPSPTTPLLLHQEATTFSINISHDNNNDTTHSDNSCLMDLAQDHHLQPQLAVDTSDQAEMLKYNLVQGSNLNQIDKDCEVEQGSSSFDNTQVDDLAYHSGQRNGESDSNDEEEEQLLLPESGRRKKRKRRTEAKFRMKNSFKMAADARPRENNRVGMSNRLLMATYVLPGKPSVW